MPRATLYDPRICALINAPWEPELEYTQLNTAVPGLDISTLRCATMHIQPSAFFTMSKAGWFGPEHSGRAGGI